MLHNARGTCSELITRQHVDSLCSAVLAGKDYKRHLHSTTRSLVEATELIQNVLFYTVTFRDTDSAVLSCIQSSTPGCVLILGILATLDNRE